MCVCVYTLACVFVPPTTKTWFKFRNEQNACRRYPTLYIQYYLKLLVSIFFFSLNFMMVLDEKAMGSRTLAYLSLLGRNENKNYRANTIGYRQSIRIKDMLLSGMTYHCLVMNTHRRLRNRSEFSTCWGYVRKMSSCLGKKHQPIKNSSVKRRWYTQI